MTISGGRTARRAKQVLVHAVATVILATSLVGVVAFAAEPAAAASPPAVGVQFHALWSDWTDAQRTAMLDKLAAAGIGWVRVDVGWRALEEGGKGNWQQWYTDLFDSVLTKAQARGIKVLATLYSSPAWIGSSTTPPNPADYADAARYVAQRFRGKVAAWEVWNEPNLSGFWSGTAAQYTAMLKAAYPAFKSGDPSALVVAGNVSEHDVPWLTKMYDAGAKGYFDVLATHPYQGPANEPATAPDDGNIWKFRHVSAVHSLMVARGDGSKPIWAGEVGWSSHTTVQGAPNWEWGVTAGQQASYVTGMLDMVKNEYPYLDHVFIYAGRNKNIGDVHEDNYGMLNYDLSEKAAFTALKSWLAANPASGLEVYPDSPTTTSTTSTTTTSTRAPSTTTTTKPPTTTTKPPTYKKKKSYVRAASLSESSTTALADAVGSTLDRLGTSA